ncbi:hypothetical protein ACS0TY_009846 [Phlomoides rotata]
MSILEGIANNSSHVDIGRGQYQRIAQVKDNDLMKTMMMTLLEKVSSLSTQQVRETLPPLVNEDSNLNVNQFLPQMEDVNYMGRQNWQEVVGSYGQGTQYQPQGTYQSQGQYHSQGPSYNQGQGKFQNPSQQFLGKATNEDALALILRKMDGIEENGKAMAQHYKNLEAQQKTMEFQIGQLATTVGHMQNKGKFPSTTEPNPKEHCKAIELRSGTRYQGPPIPNEHDNQEKMEDEIEQEAEDDKDLSEHDEE